MYINRFWDPYNDAPMIVQTLKDVGKIQEAKFPNLNSRAVVFVAVVVLPKSIPLLQLRKREREMANHYETTLFMLFR